jgi:hypothetical protein
VYLHIENKIISRDFSCALRVQKKASLHNEVTDTTYTLTGKKVKYFTRITASLSITSNQSLEDWAALFTDTTMTVAAIDRLAHHAHILQLIGESYRRKTALKQEK